MDGEGGRREDTETVFSEIQGFGIRFELNCKKLKIPFFFLNFSSFLIFFNLKFFLQIFEDDISKIGSGMKKSVNNFRVVKLLQTFTESKKSLMDLNKAVYIVAKYNHFRTQFATLEER